MVRFSAQARDAIFFAASRPTLEHTQLLVRWILGVLSLRVYRQESDADQSHLL
jgi:hypothetical protein